MSMLMSKGTFSISTPDTSVRDPSVEIVMVDSVEDPEAFAPSDPSQTNPHHNKAAQEPQQVLRQRYRKSCMKW